MSFLEQYDVVIGLETQKQKFFVAAKTNSVKHQTQTPALFAQECQGHYQS